MIVNKSQCSSVVVIGRQVVCTWDDSQEMCINSENGGSNSKINNVVVIVIIIVIIVVVFILIMIALAFKMILLKKSRKN
jgi:hypothetical protein